MGVGTFSLYIVFILILSCITPFQLQELGDLQHAMKVQEEHGKLQHQYAQLKKDHQNGVAERLQLIKQVSLVPRAIRFLA